MSKSNVPELRLEGFEGEWDKCLLSDVVSVVGGGTPSTQTPAFWGGDIDWFSPSEIGNDPVAPRSRLKITAEGLASSSAQLLPANRTVLFTSRASIGHSAILRHEAATNQGFQSFIVNSNTDVEFIYALTPYIKTHALRRASGSTFLEVSAQNLREIPMVIPAPDEQKAIGAIFTRVDTTIVSHKKKLDLFKQTKTSLLQRMFPADGATVPELRLGGFEGEWRKVQISDIATRHDSERIPVTKKDRAPGSTPYYGANGIQDYVEGYTHDGSFVLVAEDGANDLENYPVEYVTGKIWVNNHAHVLQAIPDISSGYFLKTAIFRADVKSLLVGGGRAKLNSAQLMELSFLVPSLDEQQAIGAVFSKLDTLISAEAQYIDKLTQTKTALLQKMFV